MKKLDVRNRNTLVSFVHHFNQGMTIRWLIFCAFCLFALHPGRIILAQIAPEESSPATEEATSEFPGTYIFEWPDGRSVAEIHLDGSALTVTLEISGGYIFQLAGTSEGKTAHGTIVGKSGNGDFGTFEATIDGDELQITLVPRAETDEEASEPLHLVFSRAPTVDSSAQATQDATVPEQASSSVPEGTGGDDRLVGTWVYQSLITSGSDSYASEQFLIFRDDGSYSYGRGSTVAGGSGWSYNGENEEGETERGYWRAEEGILYLRDSNGQWNRIGKFGMTEDGTTMRITYDSGGRKLWSRR